MRKIIYTIVIVSIIISCNNEQNKCVELQNDSLKVDYSKIPNSNLTKAVRYYPGGEIYSIFYINDSCNLDSVRRIFYKNGQIGQENYFINGIKEGFFKQYYSNGVLEAIVYYHNNLRKGEQKFYRGDGSLLAIEDMTNISGKETLIGSRSFDRNGDLQLDSTLYVEMLLNKDTVSLTDSAEVLLRFYKPDTVYWMASLGDYDENFILKGNNKLFDDEKRSYYNPKNVGKNYVRVLINLNLTPNKEIPEVRVYFLEKEIYVTE